MEYMSQVKNQNGYKKNQKSLVEKIDSFKNNLYSQLIKYLKNNYKWQNRIQYKNDLNQIFV